MSKNKRNYNAEVETRRKRAVPTVSQLNKAAILIEAGATVPAACAAANLDVNAYYILQKQAKKTGKPLLPKDLPTYSQLVIENHRLREERKKLRKRLAEQKRSAKPTIKK